MRRYLTQRLIYLLPTLFGVVVFGFVLLKVAGGDPVRAIAGEGAEPETVEQVRRELGLDRPVLLQFVSYSVGLVQGNLGLSYRTGRPVADEVVRRYPRTLALAAGGVALAIVAGTLLGIMAALRPYSIADYVSMVVALIGVSIPGFWLGLMLIYVFSVQLRWLPSIGLEGIQYAILPIIVNASYSLALLARMTRAGMIEVLSNDYIRTARSKGLAERVVVMRHALRNALVPLATIAGLSFGFQLSGAVITETIFSIDGIGSMIVYGILSRDMPVVQAGILVIAINFIVITLVLDVLYGFLNPRIRY